MRAFAGLGLMVLLGLCPAVSVSAQEHTFVAPDTVYAALDGTFSYEWLFTAGAGGSLIAGSGWDGGQNVSGGQHGDCFCVPDICTVEEGATLTWDVIGQLVNPAHFGTAQNWMALCDMTNFNRTTVILPAAPTTVEDPTWSCIKELFRSRPKGGD